MHVTATVARRFRMLLVGYFEGIDSERGLDWLCESYCGFDFIPDQALPRRLERNKIRFIQETINVRCMMLGEPGRNRI